jgi:hypothetical protein
MSRPLTIVVPHGLGKAEAARRIRSGMDHMRGNLASFITIEQETWDADSLHFNMRGLGQTAAGRIDVLEDALRIEVTLPWLLAKISERLMPALRSEATKLLR